MIFYHPELNLDLSSFGIEVPLLDDRVEKVVAELGLSAFDLTDLPKLGASDFARAHDDSQVANFFSADPKDIIFHAYELIDSEGRANRYCESKRKREWTEFRDIILNQVCTTCLASEWTMKNEKSSFFLGGGMHHAFPDCGRGFCVVHDVAIAIKWIQSKKLADRFIIIDVDAHKGDGQAVIFKNDPMVKTFSIHMGESWPLTEPDDPRVLVENDVDLGLSKEDSLHYLEVLEKGLSKLEEICPLEDPKRELIFVVLGADPYEEDILPSTDQFKLDLKSMKQRDQQVIDFIRKRKSQAVFVMGGGYGPESYRPYVQFLRQFREEGFFSPA